MACKNMTAVAAMVCGAAGCSAAGKAADQPVPHPDKDRPNVLFIIMDDMCDWTGYLGGHPQVITPNLDRLAANGVWFANAYCQVPFSNPSRVGMLTGMPSDVTGVYQNTHHIQDSKPVDDCILMPEHFRANGYYTLCSGKVFHTKPSEARQRAMWDDMSTVDGGYGPWPDNPGREQGRDWREVEEWTGPETDFPDVVNAAHVVDFLGGEHDKPFFVALGVYRPHAPYTAPKRYFDMYDPADIRTPAVRQDDLDDIPAYPKNNYYPSATTIDDIPDWKTDGTWQRILHGYLASVTFADDIVGRVLDALEKSPYGDNTIVVLAGDNGFHQGQKNRFGKMALWREACHVPLIIRAPGGASGSVVAPVSLIDIYPTLAGLCGLPPLDGQLRGNDLTPLVENPGSGWDKPCFSTYKAGNFAVHHGQWNYIRYINYHSNPRSHELYDLSVDEDEFFNLLWPDDNGNHLPYQGVAETLGAMIPQTWAAPLTPRTKQ